MERDELGKDSDRSWLAAIAKVAALLLILFGLYVGGAVACRVLFEKNILRRDGSALRWLSVAYRPIEGLYDKSPVFATGFDSCVGMMVNNKWEHASLDIMIQNWTRAPIDEATVILGEHRWISGALGVGATNVKADWHYPVATEAVVQWCVEGSVRSSTISLGHFYGPRAPARSTRGSLVFSINPTNTTVVFVRK